MKNIKNLFISLLFLGFFLPAIIQAQTAFISLPDATGYGQNTPQHLLDSLEVASSALRSALPNEYQSDFAVYDLGFYSHHSSLIGGIPDVITNAITNHVTHPYYLLFGREIDEEGGLKKVWVEVELPESNCLDQITPIYIDGIGFLMELEFLVSNSLNNFVLGYKYFMSELSKLIYRKMDCCYEALGGSTSRQYIPIEIHCDICLESTFVQDSFEVITITNEPKMPVIGIQCLTPNPGICVNLRAELKIYFARNCEVDKNGNSPDRHRRDTIIKTIENFQLFNYLMFEFGTEIHWDNEWDLIQGGKAEISVFDDEDNLIFFYPFSILGTNPSIVTVCQHLNEFPYNQLWFFKKLAIHESASNKGQGIEMRQFNLNSSDHEDLFSVLEWEAWSRTPNRGPPCGWGITQLDNERPHQISMWNWKANIHEAYDRLVGEYLRNARDHLIPRIENAYQWDINPDNKNNLTVTLNDTLIGDVQWVWQGSEYFSDDFLISKNSTTIPNYHYYFPNLATGNNRSFLDGEILRRYNGLGSPNRRFLNLYEIMDDSKTPPQKIGQKWVIYHDVNWSGSVNYYIISISDTGVPNH